MDEYSLLRLQIEWGADEALDDAPFDRLRVRPASPPPSPAPVRAAPAPAVAQGSAAERAQAAALAALSLDDLRVALTHFDGCALRDTATKLVFASGDPESQVLIVGEPPGADEDRSGEPFAGKDGQLLDRMLASIGVTRDQMHLVPLVPWRPPGGRPVTAAEVTVCLPFLHRLIALTQPGYLLLFGPQVARALLGAGVRARDPGRFLPCTVPGVAKPIETLVAPALAGLARAPAQRKAIWAALRTLRHALDRGS